MGGITTVKLKKETRDMLAKMGNKKETYDDVIKKLIEFYRDNKGS